MPFICFLCSTNTPKIFSSKNSLSIHEKIFHPNNKIIPHLRCLTSPFLYDIHHFKQSFIMQLKVHLQFHRSEPRTKTLKMEPFSEGLFNVLFYNEPTFQYSPAKRIYICKFKERVYKDSNMQLRCGSMHFEFNVDVRDFVKGN
ncbi:hypothetical protein C1646_820031 [Rhizophagus diaphanus]|nr:hypothetical protein C1646_820031 [Rhizophagus diaphanus] [Rhizophagus sp. MUCL 43196]